MTREILGALIVILGGALSGALWGYCLSFGLQILTVDHNPSNAIALGTLFGVVYWVYVHVDAFLEERRRRKR